MANEIRLRSNNKTGTTTDNPLLIGATTINSAGFVSLPTVDTTNHLLLVLDPTATAGTPEIVQVTAHAASSSVCTVVRGFDTTTPRQHALGTTWFHGPVVSDYNFTDKAALSTNRPASPTQGQMIYETDTDSYVGRAAGSVWQTVVPLGAWTSYTPTFSNFTLGNGTLTASYARMGRTIVFRVTVVLGTTSVMGTDPLFTLPVTAASYNTHTPIGDCNILDASAADFLGTVWATSTTQGRIITWLANATYVTGAVVTATVPMTWTSTDGFMIVGTYEAAS